MREIDGKEITAVVAKLCIEANRELPASLEELVRAGAKTETSPITGNGRAHLQDTGMAVVLAEVGQEVHIAGNFEEVVNQGVREGYTRGLLRCSVVADPLRRVNTGDNTPAVIHTRLVPGDRLRLTIAPKGFGSENMSRLKMFTPAAGEEEIVAFVAQTVKEAGGNPCPPVVLGVGIGGDFELCAQLAKRALCREASVRNPDPYYAALEAKMLEAVNETGVGPQGFGGSLTALAVNIEAYPTHIAGLPVAVNVGCHVTRHRTAVL